jgi:hypothetical protein
MLELGFYLSRSPVGPNIILKNSLCTYLTLPTYTRLTRHIWQHEVSVCQPDHQLA